MKPLTIEELKALPVGEWIWVDFSVRNEKFYAQIKKNNAVYADLNSLRLWQEFDYSDYGKTWIAYKNKEQAEEDKQ